MDPSKPNSFNHRTEKLSTGRTYHFVDQTPDNYDPKVNTTLLLVHGFPDLWFGWRYQIGPWVKAGYRVVAPDMLGYGGTDKPKDVAEYTTKKLSADLAAILDLIGVQKAVVIGHDWGSAIVGRFALWHPDRILALIHLSIAFVGVPTAYRSLEQLVELVPQYGYQLYFANDSSTKDIEANIQGFLNTVFMVDNPTALKLSEEDGIRSLIVGGAQFDPDSPSMFSSEEMSYVLSQFDTMHGPLSYYRTTKLRFDEEQAANLNGQLGPDLPVLFMRGLYDPSSPARAVERMKRLVPQANVISLPAGHWVMLECKERIKEDVLAWLKQLTLKSKL